MSIGAEHYYGELKTYRHNDEIEDVELKRKITEVSEARYLSKKVGYKGAYKVDDETECFTTEQQVIQEARLQYKKYFPNTKVIILGGNGYHEPQKIILGPRNFKKINNRYWEAYELAWKLGRKKNISDDEICRILKPIEKEWEKFWPVK